MFKWALVGGVFAMLGISGISLGSIVSGVFAVAIGLLVLAIVLQIAAVVFEKVARRWIVVPQHGNSVRMSGPRSAV